MNTTRHGSMLFVLLLVFLATTETRAADVAQIKVSTGSVYIERGGQRLAAPVGTGVQATDTIVTGADGKVGITFVDDSRLSAGPNSTLAINRFSFNQNTHAGTMDTTLKRGTLSVVSGKLAKQSPDAVTVRTPSTILGVRGTEFVVRAGE